ncbi:hypothetical protein ACIO3O_05915 [Streptomyces sp. NPDC087440]|uniref:hypothetical protein n=1 Tax=Streptomyces sp. NPDC087440 TaxID=3365790 RepID=UPI0038050BBA
MAVRTVTRVAAGAAAAAALAGMVLGDESVVIRVGEGVFACGALLFVLLPSRALLRTGRPVIVKASSGEGAVAPGLVGRRTSRVLYVLAIVVALFNAALSGLTGDYGGMCFPSAMALFFLASMLLGTDMYRAQRAAVAPA